MGTTAAVDTADERMQRTERQLIEAALAVNEAPTLDGALESLADAARTLSGADRVSVIRWEADLSFGVVTATTGGGVALGARVPCSPLGAEQIGRSEPFVVDERYLGSVPKDQLAVVRSAGTILVVPVSSPGSPTLTFQASWADTREDHEVEAAVAKLRLLGRLTRIAFRAELERARARAERRLRAVIDAVPDGLVVRSNEGTTVNGAARSLLGTDDDPPERIGLRELDGTAVAADETPLRRAMDLGETQHYTLRVERYDGVERIHEGTIAPVADENGDVFATVTVFRDVTEQFEQQFLTQQFFEQLFHSLPMAVAITDPHTFAIRTANSSFVDLVGLTHDELVGVEPPYPFWAEEYTTREVADERISKWERLFRRKDGTLVPVELSSSVIRDASGNPSAIVVLIADLSERRAFEQRLIQSGKLASIGELAAGVAHEVNNPLFAILGLVEFLLIDAEPGTKAHERLSVIQETALEIKEIVRALLDFARERSDERHVISLTDVATQTVELMRRTSAAKHVELVERYGDESVPVLASGNQLKQIFVNLISNANQALKDVSGAVVTIEVGRDGDVAWAEVRDNGPGIAPDAAAKIFEPFFTTRRDSGGTGLGLSVSYGIAEAHGGSLTVDSAPGEGAAFRLRLPVAAEGCP